MDLKTGFCTLALCLALAPPARDAGAASAGDAAGRYALGEVVVSGPGPDGAPGAEAGQTLYTVSAEEIRTSGARTLDQALMLLPGVNVRTGAEGVPRIDIRGFRTRHVLLLLNGVPMNSAFDMQFDPTAVPTENIAQIKLTSGASSVLYGQGGLGGVINIVTRKGTPGVHGSVSAEAGDRAPYLAAGTLSTATDRIDCFLSGSALGVDGFPLSGSFQPTPEEGGGSRNNSDRERRNLLGTFGFTPTMDLALGVTVNYSQGNYGKPPGTINDPADPFASPPKYARMEDYSGLYLQLAAEYAASERLNLRGWGYLGRSEEELNRYDDARYDSFLADGSYRQRLRTSVAGVALQPGYDLRQAGSVSFSLSADASRWDNAGIETVNPVPGAPPSFGDLAARRSLGVYSAAVEYEVAPLPGLGLVAGYGRYWQRRSEADQEDFSLLAGASYDVAQGTRLKGSYKRNVRFPSLEDLYDLSKGNPQLCSEVSRGVEAGVEQVLSRGSRLSLTGFYTKAENLIQNDQAAGRNLNIAEVRFKGVELSAETRPVERLFLRAGYTYLDSEDRSRPGRDELQYNPRDKVTLEARYETAGGYTGYLSLLCVANRYLYTKDSIAVVQKARLEDYAVVNVRVGRRVLRDRLALYLGANNLFDENYETSYGFPQPGRFVYGGFEFRI